MKKDTVLEMIEEKEVVLVKDLLPYLKANKSTYNNLDKSSISSFKKIYSECKNKSEIKINSICLGRIRNILNDDSVVLDILYKTKIMDVLLSIKDCK